MLSAVQWKTFILMTYSASMTNSTTARNKSRMHANFTATMTKHENTRMESTSAEQTGKSRCLLSVFVPSGLSHRQNARPFQNKSDMVEGPSTEHECERASQMERNIEIE